MILKGLRPNHYIDVDGVQFAIPWNEVRAGTSFFIPCVNTRNVIKQVRFYFKKEGWKFKYAVRAENNYFGVRIWRIL